MPPRPYDSEGRQRKHAELKARIAAAAAALHARKGARATSYADIAAEAGVSTPTVYAHFATMDDLLAGCTSHVAANAPAFPSERILAAPTLDDAASLLTDALVARHQYYEPWLAWREDRVFPFLAGLAGSQREAMRALIARVVAGHLGPGAHREAVAGWESALSFDFWHRLARGHELPAAAVRRVIVHTLHALARPPTAAPKASSRSVT